MFFSNRMQMQNVLVSCFTLARNKALSHEQRAMLEDFCKRLIGLNLNLNLQHFEKNAFSLYKVVIHGLVFCTCIYFYAKHSQTIATQRKFEETSM